MKKFNDINKGSKSRRLNKICRMIDVPKECDDLWDCYNGKNDKNEEYLYMMRDILLNLELPNNINQMLE